MEIQESKMGRFSRPMYYKITPGLFKDADDKMAIFSGALCDIEADDIPKTSLFRPTKKEKPNLGLMRILKQLKRNELKWID